MANKGGPGLVGGGGGGGGGQGRCELRIEVIVKIQKIVGRGGQGGCEPRIEAIVKTRIYVYETLCPPQI